MEMLASAHTFVGNYAFMISCPKACDLGPRGPVLCSHLISRVCSISSCSRRLLSRMHRASWMFSMQSLMGKHVLVDRVGCAPMLQDEAVCGPWLSVPRENCRSTLACCTTAPSKRLWRFRYIVFASGLLDSGMEQSIMAAAAMFCVGLRKYCALLLLSAS